MHHRIWEEQLTRSQRYNGLNLEGKCAFGRIDRTGRGNDVEPWADVKLVSLPRRSLSPRSNLLLQQDIDLRHGNRERPIAERSRDIAQAKLQLEPLGGVLDP